MAADAVTVVLSAAVFFEIFGNENTESDEDAKELANLRTLPKYKAASISERVIGWKEVIGCLAWE